MMHGTAFKRYGFIHSSLINLGKTSVGESDVKIIVKVIKVYCNADFLLLTNHKATPLKAKINVGDSAL